MSVLKLAIQQEVIGARNAGLHVSVHFLTKYEQLQQAIHRNMLFWGTKAVR